MFCRYRLELYKIVFDASLVAFRADLQRTLGSSKASHIFGESATIVTACWSTMTNGLRLCHQFWANLVMEEETTKTTFQTGCVVTLLSEGADSSLRNASRYQCHLFLKASRNLARTARLRPLSRHRHGMVAPVQPLQPVSRASRATWTQTRWTRASMRGRASTFQLDFFPVSAFSQPGVLSATSYVWWGTHLIFVGRHWAFVLSPPAPLPSPPFHFPSPRWVPFRAWISFRWSRVTHQMWYQVLRKFLCNDQVEWSHPQRSSSCTQLWRCMFTDHDSWTNSTFWFVTSTLTQINLLGPPRNPA